MGFGWGLVTGDFNTTQNVTGSKYYTSFSGPIAYQILGIQIEMGARYGLNAEFKTLRAYATTSNDPFDQGSGDALELSLDGVIIGLTGYYRF